MLSSQSRLADDHARLENDMKTQKYRNDLLEEKLNDLTENHQSEVIGIKQVLTDSNLMKLNQFSIAKHYLNLSLSIQYFSRYIHKYIDAFLLPY